MNICHIVPIYLPGILPGCSKYIQDVSEHLSKRGHDVVVLTSNAINAEGGLIHYLANTPPKMKR